MKKHCHFFVLLIFALTIKYKKELKTKLEFKKRGFGNKATTIKGPFRIELTINDLQVKLANYNSTTGHQTTSPQPAQRDRVVCEQMNKKEPTSIKVENILSK